MGLLLLNSRGLNTKMGALQIYHKLIELGFGEFGDKKIFLISHPVYKVDEFILRNCSEIMGFSRENIYLSESGIPDTVIPDFLYVTEGNTFEVLSYMRDKHLVDYIRDIYLKRNKNVVYIGSSAGAIIAGSDILLAEDFDTNYMKMADYTGLGLFEGTIIPHYEPEELRRYKSYTDKGILKRYKYIYSVGNDDVKVMKS